MPRSACFSASPSITIEVWPKVNFMANESSFRGCNRVSQSAGGESTLTCAAEGELIARSVVDDCHPLLRRFAQQISQRVSHWVRSQPQFARMKVFEHAVHSANVIGVSMSEGDGVQNERCHATTGTARRRLLRNRTPNPNLQGCRPHQPGE